MFIQIIAVGCQKDVYILLHDVMQLQCAAKKAQLEESVCTRAPRCPPSAPSCVCRHGCVAECVVCCRVCCMCCRVCCGMSKRRVCCVCVVECVVCVAECVVCCRVCCRMTKHRVCCVTIPLRPTATHCTPLQCAYAIRH